jgi:hypothetical protein
MADRLPDFVIIGAMKSATSTLYHWLEEQPECFLATPKETNFFGVEKDWERGIGWYAGLFAGARDEQLTGEASVIYTVPSVAERAAERMRATIPNAKLIYVVREPVERIRSHYRHEVQRHRETRSLHDAVSEPGNEYVGTSRYFACLAPYIDRFPREQILVVSYEELVRAPYPGWSAVLRFLGLADRPSPGTAHNVTAESEAWTGALLWLRRVGVFSFRRAAMLPTPIRKLGKRVFTRGGATFERKLERSQAPVPPEVIDEVGRDAERLDAWLGRERPLWAQPTTAPRS